MYSIIHVNAPLDPWKRITEIMGNENTRGIIFLVLIKLSNRIKKKSIDEYEKPIEYNASPKVSSPVM